MLHVKGQGSILFFFYILYTSVLLLEKYYIFKTKSYNVSSCSLMTKISHLELQTFIRYNHGTYTYTYILFVNVYAYSLIIRFSFSVVHNMPLELPNKNTIT